MIDTAMAVEFPNHSRSYDESRQRIRFSGYDGTREIHMFIEEAAVWLLDAGKRSAGAGLLAAFDHHRERICKAAAIAYGRNREGYFTLTAKDFG